MKRFLLVLFLIVSLSSWSYATTYYVDNTITDTHVASATPDCSNYDPSTFACSGGFASAYATVADINAGSFSAGDQILFRKGQTWHEQFTLPSVGSSGNPITVSSFGSGAQPMFDGADVQATWTSESLGGAANLTCDANLQGYWYFENNLNDSTSHGNTLTGVSSPGFSNTTVKQGSYSLGALNGSSQYAYRDDRDLSAGFVGKDGTTNTAITFGAWVYATSFTNWGPAISKVGGGLSYGLKVVRNPGIWQWRFMVTLDSTERDMDSDSDAVLNAWTHMVGRVDPVSKKAEFFINGVKQTASYSATSTTIGTSTSRLNIGYASGGYLTGYIDEAFVFNRALSDTEIQGIYNYGFAGGGNTTTVYHTNTGTYSSDPLQAFQIDGSTVTRYLRKASKDLLTTGSWHYDSTNTRAYIRTTADDDPSNHTIEISARSYGVNSASPHTNIVLDGIHVTRTQSYGIGGFPTVQNCTADYNHDEGIKINIGNQTFRSNTTIYQMTIPCQHAPNG